MGVYSYEGVSGVLGICIAFASIAFASGLPAEANKARTSFRVQHHVRPHCLLGGGLCTRGSHT